MLGAIGVLDDVATRVLRAVCPQAHQEVQRQREAGGDISVLDCFHYSNAAQAADRYANCPEHLDPGFLTLGPSADTPGLQILDTIEGSWVDVDIDCDSSSGHGVILFVDESLEAYSKGAFKAARHRVCDSNASRTSLLYELRLDTNQSNLQHYLG